MKLLIIFCIVGALFLAGCDEYEDFVFEPVDECSSLFVSDCFSGYINTCELYDYEMLDYLQSDDNIYKKAFEFEKYIEENHLHHGLITDAIMTTTEHEIGEEYVETYINCERSMFLSGIYLFAQSFRYTYTNESESLEKIVQVVRAIEKSFLIAQNTGKEGLAATYFAENTLTNTSVYQEQGLGFFNGTNPYGSYYWQDLITKADYSALMLGLNAAYDAVSDQTIKDIIEYCVCSVADAIMNNDLKIQIESTDGVTEDMGYRYLGNKWVLDYSIANPSDTTHENGFHLLSIILLAYKITCDNIYLNYYNNTLIENMKAIKDMEKWDCGNGENCFPDYTDYPVVNSALMSLYNLILIETYNSQLHQNYLEILENNFLPYLQDDKNAWFYLLYTHANDGNESSGGLSTINDQLNLFAVPPLRDDQESVADNSSLLERDGSNNILALDINNRKYDSFIWENSPVDYKTDLDTDNALKEFSGIDYVSLYWAAVNLGYIEPEGQYIAYKWLATDEECSE